MNWDKTIEDLGPRLFRYFCARFSKEQADDLTQETLLRLFKKVDQGGFDDLKGNISMFAFGIAHYVSLESKKMQNKDQFNNTEKLDLIQNEQESSESVLIKKEMVQKVSAKLLLLNEIEQQILALYIDDELTTLKISEILELPEGTIKSHVFRAKNKLITLVNEEN